MRNISEKLQELKLFINKANELLFVNCENGLGVC